MGNSSEDFSVGSGMNTIKPLVWTRSNGNYTTIWTAPVGESGRLLITKGEMGFDLFHDEILIGSRFTLDGVQHLASEWIGDA